MVEHEFEAKFFLLYLTLLVRVCDLMAPPVLIFRSKRENQINSKRFFFHNLSGMEIRLTNI